MVAIKQRPIGVSASLGGRGQGYVSAVTGSTALIAGLAAEPGFTPVELMDAALAGCLVLSVRIAARKHGWGERLERVDVRVDHRKAPDLPSRVESFGCAFEIVGDFSEAERQTLIAQAHEICTVGNTLARGAEITDMPETDGDELPAE